LAKEPGRKPINARCENVASLPSFEMHTRGADASCRLVTTARSQARS
jgi:hypothetical protein